MLSVILKNVQSMTRAPLNHSPARQWRVYSRIWRVKICSPVWRMIQPISTFYIKYNQSMWIEHSHVAYQWKANQIFNLVCYTSTNSRRGYIFTAVCLCVCLSVCLCVYVFDSACEQNSSRTDTTIWRKFSLNGCLAHQLKPY